MVLRFSCLQSENPINKIFFWSPINITIHLYWAKNISFEKRKKKKRSKKTFTQLGHVAFKYREQKVFLRICLPTKFNRTKLGLLQRFLYIFTCNDLFLKVRPHLRIDDEYIWNQHTRKVAVRLSSYYDILYQKCVSCKTRNITYKLPNPYEKTPTFSSLGKSRWLTFIASYWFHCKHD